MDQINDSNPVSWPTPAPQQPLRRFRLRTVLVPLLFLFLHFIVINIVATIYVVIYIVVTSGGSSADMLAILSDSARLNALTVEQYPIITVFYTLALIPVYLVYLSLSRRRDARSLLLERTRLADVLPALGMIIGAVGVTNIWFNVLLWLQDRVPFVQTQMDDYMKTAGAFTADNGYLWLILGISILAPIAEELVFRGIIQGELRKAMPEWAAIVIQAVVFALFHMQPVQITYVLLPGLLLGLAYYWSRSLWVPILMHITFNFLGSVLPALVGADETLNSILFISECVFIAIGVLAGIFFALNRRRPAAAATVPQSAILPADRADLI